METVSFFNMVCPDIIYSVINSLDFDYVKHKKLAAQLRII